MKLSTIALIALLGADRFDPVDSNSLRTLKKDKQKKAKKGDETRVVEDGEGRVGDPDCNAEPEACLNRVAGSRFANPEARSATCSGVKPGILLVKAHKNLPLNSNGQIPLSSVAGSVCKSDAECMSCCCWSNNGVEYDPETGEPGRFCGSIEDATAPGATNGCEFPEPVIPVGGGGLP